MELKNKIQNAKLGETHLFYVGQAGYIIKSSKGTTLAVDLYLSDCVETLEGQIGFKRLMPKILQPKDIDFDYIIATHPHWDHFDIDSIPQMMDGTESQLFASVECRQYEDRYGIDFRRIKYVKPGDSYNFNEMRIYFIDCDHGMGAPDAVGVIIEVDNRRILMTGDTCLRLDRVNAYRKYGDIDILVGPINGTYGNMNEQDFVELSKALSPKLTIPCHFGMFASHGGDPRKFIKIMSGQKGNYMLMTMGEKIVLQKGVIK